MEKINLLVILGTGHKGSSSEKIAEFLFQEIKKKSDVNVSYLDVKTLNLSVSDDGAYKVDENVSKQLAETDGFIIVFPEYNHSFPGSLKIFLDSYYDEYLRKPVGMVGISSGVFGGARAMMSLIPVLRRLGMVVIQKDLNIGTAGSFLNEDNQARDPEFNKRLEVFLQDLIWYASALKSAKK
jgi:NAD(P)H-dependent FMN reductase